MNTNLTLKDIARPFDALDKLNAQKKNIQDSAKEAIGKIEGRRAEFYQLNPNYSQCNGMSTNGVNKPLKIEDALPFDSEIKSVQRKAALQTFGNAMKIRAVATLGVFGFNVVNAVSNAFLALRETPVAIALAIPQLVQYSRGFDVPCRDHNLISVAKTAIKALIFAALSIVSPLIGLFSPEKVQILQGSIALDHGNQDEKNYIELITLSNIASQGAYKAINGDRQKGIPSAESLVKSIEKARTQAEATPYLQQIIDRNDALVERINTAKDVVKSTLLSSDKTTKQAELIVEKLTQAYQILGKTESAARYLAGSKPTELSLFQKMQDSFIAHVSF